MSDIRLHVEALPATNEPLRLAVRRMRWFKAAFTRHAQATGRDLGCAFAVDETRLAAAFLRWLQAIAVQKPADKADRRAFFEFAAALMLRELTADLPLTATRAATGAATGTAIGAPAQPDPAPDPASAAAFWPEGYCCTTFCLSVHAAAMAQEFHAATAIDAAAADLRFWWSFKENAAQDARLSAGFLQLLLGRDPNWLFPDVFRARLAPP